MRTTLDIDSDMLEAARSLAETRRTSIGKALSELARRGATAHHPVVLRDGFCIFEVPSGAPQFGPDEVRAALDEEDAAFARQFTDKPRP
jgi:hypothetical protein